MTIIDVKTNSVLDLERAILPRLSERDDPSFWLTVIWDLEQAFSRDGIDETRGYEIFLQIGACSHWLRPHQTRLTSAGGFALPAGYLGSGFGRDGLPEFDWFVLFHRNQTEAHWSTSNKFFGKRQLICRIALPTRTLQHDQAVINILWSPGTPARPKEKAKFFYAYRKVSDDWTQVANGNL